MATTVEEQSTADRVYIEVRDMAARFAFKPNERINEGQLARQVSASRTPLREALNRLTAEGFVSFRPGQGFFCRSLNPDDILDLYEARQAIEAETARLATERASDESLAALRETLAQGEPEYHAETDTALLVELDETFHMRIAELAGNSELCRILANLNARSRFVRTIDMDHRRAVTPADHWRVFEAIAARDPDKAAHAMRDHISRRRDEATEAARQAFSRLYVTD